MTTRAFCLGFLLLATACDDGSTGCTAGATQICTCGSLSGTQTCSSDGTFGACMCSGPDAGMSDGGTSADAGTLDASSLDASSPDASTSTGDAATGDCDFTGFAPTSSTTTASNDPDFNPFDPSLSLNLTTDHESMYLDLLFGWGAQDAPHTFTFTNENYADCTECLLMYAECAGPTDPACGATYLAVSGTATFSALDHSMMAGTLENVRMIEVTLDDALVSTPVPGGRVWCIPSLEFP